MIFNEETKLGELFGDEDSALDCVYYVTRKLDMTDQQEEECLKYTVRDIAEMEGVDAEKLGKKIQKYAKKNAQDFVDDVEFVSVLDDDYNDEEDTVIEPEVHKAAPVPPVQPVAQPAAQPVAAPVQPVAQPVQPIAQPVQPIAQPVQPIAQPTPSAQPVQITVPKTKDPAQAAEVLRSVRDSLESAGYDPYKQLTQYFVTKDATYITSKDNARNLIRSVKIDELIETIVRNYFN